MAGRPYIALELSLAETAGPWGKAGWPQLYCWLKAVHVPGTEIDDATISIVARVPSTGSWREHTRRLTMAESRAILESLDRLGIPEKPPEVEGVVDTSDGWSTLSFRVKVEDRTCALEIPMHSSGFDGSHAEGLRRLFRQLFDFAGYSDYSPVIYGQR